MRTYPTIISKLSGTNLSCYEIAGEFLHRGAAGSERGLSVHEGEGHVAAPDCSSIRRQSLTHQVPCVPVLGACVRGGASVTRRLEAIRAPWPGSGERGVHVKTLVETLRRSGSRRSRAVIHRGRRRGRVRGTFQPGRCCVSDGRDGVGDAARRTGTAEFEGWRVVRRKAGAPLGRTTDR